MDPPIPGGRALGPSRLSAGRTLPQRLQQEGDGVREGPRAHGRREQAWPPPSGPRCPVHPGAERAAQVQPSGALPRAWGDRQGPQTPPRGPTLSATACAAGSGGLWGTSGSLRMCGQCPVGAGGGRQVGKATVRFRTQSSEEPVQLSVHRPRWLNSVNFRGTASRPAPRPLDGSPTPKPSFLPGREPHPQSWFCF